MDKYKINDVASLVTEYFCLALKIPKSPRKRTLSKLSAQQEIVAMQIHCPTSPQLQFCASYMVEQMTLKCFQNIEVLKEEWQKVQQSNGSVVKNGFNEHAPRKPGQGGKIASSMSSTTTSSSKSPAVKKPHLLKTNHQNFKRKGPAFRKVSGSKYHRSPRARPLPQLRNGSGGSSGVSDIEWPDSTFFEPDIGRSKIIEFIEKTWTYDTTKLEYTVEHVYSAKLKTTKRFKYRVCWLSRPDDDARVVTASVYFNVDIPLKPDTPIDVAYTFQGDKHLHKPGKSRFHHQWLKDVAKGNIFSPNSAQ